MNSRKNLRIVVLTGYGPGLVNPLLNAGFNIVGLMEPESYYRREGKLKRFLKSVRTLLRFGKSELTLEGIARRRGIAFLDFEIATATESANWLKAQKPDLLVVYRAPILKPDLLSIPVQGVLNLHPSLLPRYRGGHPLLWMAANMDLEGGATVHYIDEHIDRGDIVAQATFPITAGMSEGQVEKIAVEKYGIGLLTQAIENVAQGTVTRHPQPADSPTPAAKRVSDEFYWKMIDWGQWSIEHAWHFLRCTDKWRSRLPAGETRPYNFYQIGEVERGANTDRPGDFQRDTKGLYIVHPQGKIRIRAVFSLTKMLKAILQR